MSIGELGQAASSSPDTLAASPPSLTSPVAGRTPAGRRVGLLWITAVVVAVDWASKAAAWRLLPGEAIINADTSGALPILPGLISQPALGAVVDAAALVLLAVSGLWLTRTRSLPGTLWAGCALIWAGMASNAADRWFGHLWLAPGSRRGVVDWIGVDAGGSINLADMGIGVGILLAIVALALTRLSRRALAAVAIGVLVLVPVSMHTVQGTRSNAAPVVSTPSYAERVRSMLWVGPEYKGRRVLWRDWRRVAGWNVTVQAVDAQGLVLAEWRLPWESTVRAVRLPAKTERVYVTLDDNGWTMTLADNLR